MLDTIRELCLILGFVAFNYGVWLIYEPAMFIISGLVIIYLGLPPRSGGD
jgi:hypothetical protein